MLEHIDPRDGSICNNKRSVCEYDGTEKCTRCGHIQQIKNTVDPPVNPYYREWVAKDPLYFGSPYKDLQCIRRS